MPTAPHRRRGRPRGSRLDQEERRIRQMLSQGLSQREIAGRLGVHEGALGGWIRAAKQRWEREEYT